MGRRSKKTTQTETTYYHYNDEGLAGEYDQDGNPIRQYGYKPDSTWTTDPLYQKTSLGYAYYLTDHLGTPHQMMKKNGAMVWKAKYRAFGEVKNEEKQTGWDNPLRFAGQYYDAETGLSYNYFRDYDPETGRYITSDPIGLQGGLNTYGYVGANPLNRIDPDGLWCRSAGVTHCKGVCRGRGEKYVSCETKLEFVFPDIIELWKCECCSGGTNDQNDRDRLEKERDHLRRVEKELREQLDNGRRQMEREIRDGHRPNPHGLGREVNESIPNEIRNVQRRLNEINGLLDKY